MADFELFARGGGVEVGEVARGVDGRAVRVGHFSGVVDETGVDAGCGTADCSGEMWAGQAKSAVHMCQCDGSALDRITLRGVYISPWSWLPLRVMTRCVDALTLSHAGTTKIMISPAIKTNTTTEEGRAVHTCHKLGTRSCRPPDTRLARQYEVVELILKVA